MLTDNSRIKRKVMLTVMCFCIITLLQAVTGTVFVVTKEGGGEKKAFAGCLVSDGVNIVKADEKGGYVIDTKEPYIFIITPDGYTCRNWYSALSGHVDFKFITFGE